MDLSALSNVTTAASTLGNLILVSPQKTVGYQPQNAPSWANNTSKPPPTLLFNYEGEQSMTLTSDITDHFIENNTTIQDQIALKPETFATHGFVGELNDIAPIGLQTAKVLAQKLVAVGAYAPQLSATALLAYNEAAFLYQTVQSTAHSAISTWSSINGTGDQTVINGATQVKNGEIVGGQSNQTQQQIYFQQLYAYWKARTLFTIQTPWAVFQDMAIQTLRAVQDAETRVITDFEVTFKLMRFATTQITRSALYTPSDAQGRAAVQGAGEVDYGTNTLKPSTTSFASKVQ